jgi:hypothetical protein
VAFKVCGALGFRTQALAFMNAAGKAALSTVITRWRFGAGLL